MLKKLKVKVKVNQSLEQTTVDLRNVMVASSEIINLILVPQMKEKMLEIETQVRNEVKMNFDREKKEMAADMEAKFAEEKQTFVTNLQNEYRLKEQALVDNLEEKREKLRMKENDKVLFVALQWCTPSTKLLEGNREGQTEELMQHQTHMI